jgi:hypothetical protein
MGVKSFIVHALGPQALWRGHLQKYLDKKTIFEENFYNFTIVGSAQLKYLL